MNLAGKLRRTGLLATAPVLAALAVVTAGGCGDDPLVGQSPEDCFELQGQLAQVTSDTLTTDHLESSISPDGTKILFSTDFWSLSDYDDKPARDIAIIDTPVPGELRGPVNRLFDVGNAKRLRLLNLRNDDGRIFNPDDVNVLSNKAEPTWHPDGVQFACVVTNLDNRDRIYYGQVDFGSENQQDIQTSNMTLLDDVGISGPIEYFYHAPAFSPDGQWLAYTRNFFKPGDPNNNIPDEIEDLAIYAYNLGDGTSIKVSQGSSFETDPAWSPDGQWLAFTSNRDGRAGALEVYKIRFDPAVTDPGDRDGATRLTVENSEADPKIFVGSFDPTWVSSNRIVFVSTRRAPCTSLRDRNLWSMNASGGDVKLVFFSRSDDHFPSVAVGGGGPLVFSTRSNPVEDFDDQKTDLYVLNGF